MNGFWYGSTSLWTFVRLDGFRTAGHETIFAQIVYWRVGFDWHKEPDPTLMVEAKRLDVPAPLGPTVRMESSFPKTIRRGAWK